MPTFIDSTPIIDDPPALRDRMQRDGHLFVSGLLPADELEALRLRFLAIARDAGWVKADTPLEDAIADQDGFCVEPTPEYMDVYSRMYALPEFHALQHHPALVGLLEKLFDDPVLPHPRLIGRTIFPKRESFTTPPHQDFIPIQGTAETYTAWFPLHDLPPTMGGLEVAAGAHRGGVYNFQPALGAGGLAITDSFEWTGGPFAQGDVLFFHSMMPHRGVPNTSEQLRLSIDARYQRVADPIAPGSLLPHSQPNTWEAIYAEWPDDRLQYYWREYELDVVDYDNSYHEERDRQALELGEQGDPLAVSALQRIIARDKNPDKRQRAAELLAAMETLQK